MTDVLTPAKSLTKQTIGGNSNTWGTILNASIDKIDAALGQQVSIAITGDRTISATEAQNIGYKFTGTPGANKIVTWPTFYGPLIVRNAITDGSALTCGMGGAAIKILAGYVALIFSDGVDFVLAGIDRKVAALDYYTDFTVASGDTSGDGTAGNPWKTLQKAHNVLFATIDGAGQAVTIHQVAGVDTGGLVASGAIPGIDLLSIIINGGISTANPFGIEATRGARLAVTNNATIIGASNDIVAATGGFIKYQGGTLGVCASAKIWAQVGEVVISGNYNDDAGAAASHWLAEEQGKILVSTAATLIAQNGAAYTQFALADTGGLIVCDQALFIGGTGPSTGQRYNVATAGGIYRHESVAGALPGTGSTTDAATFGWYK